MLLLQGLIFLAVRRLVSGKTTQRVVSVLLALPLAALLDGATPDGVEVEREFGHPFFFYLIANAPVAVGVLFLLLLWQRIALIRELERT